MSHNLYKYDDPNIPVVNLQDQKQPLQQIIIKSSLTQPESDYNNSNIL